MAEEESKAAADQASGIEKRRAKRYDIPPDMPTSVELHDDNDVVLFTGKIIDISTLGICMDTSANPTIMKSLASLRTTNNLQFPNCSLILNNDAFSTGIVWVWDNSSGRSGMQFYDMGDATLEKLKKFIKANLEKPAR